MKSKEPLEDFDIFTEDLTEEFEFPNGVKCIICPSRDFPTNDVGKWLIFEKPEEAYKLWEKIKVACKEGLLGGSAKIIPPNPEKYHNNTCVICVYTNNWKDVKDVRRVREELRKLGVTKKIPYKTDRDTWDGKYAKNGYKHISKYFE